MEDPKRNSPNGNEHLNSSLPYVQEDSCVFEKFKTLLKSNLSDLCPNDFYESCLFEIICETGDDSLINFLFEIKLIDDKIKNQVSNS